MFSDLCCECLCWDFKFDCTIAVPSSLLYLSFVSQLSLSVPFGPQREKMYLRTIILVLEKQSYAECMMFLESVILYLTRLFDLFCE